MDPKKRTRLRWKALFLLLTSCAADLAAQEVTLRSGTSEVLVDVVVRDKKGHLVHGLAGGDFRIIEDNVPQAATSWREIQSGATASPDAPPEKPAREVYVQSNRQQTASVHVARQLRLVSLVFDKLGEDGRKNARLAAIDFLDHDLGPNVYYAVFYIDRYFKVVQTYTNKVDLLRRAIETATGGARSALTADSGGMERAYQQSSYAEGTSDALLAVSGAMGGGAPQNVQGGVLADEQAARFTDQMLQLSDRLNRTDLGQVSIFSLWAILKQLERLPGRKSMLYFSEGYTLPNELWMQFASLISAANRANVVVDVLDARGVLPAGDQDLSAQLFKKGLQMSNRMTRARSSDSASAVRDFRAADYELDSLRGNGQMVLRELAESTGGTLIANTNDLRPQLRRLSEEFNTWYELTYHAANPNYDGRFRAIQVTVPAHPDYVVQARSGYYALPPMEGQFVFPFEVPLLRALGASPLPRNLDFSAAIIPYRHLPNGLLQSSLVFDLPLKSIEFSWDEKSSSYVTHLSVLSLVKDERGVVVAKLSRDVPLSEPKERLEGYKQGRFIVTLPVDLPPGRYTVESVAADQRGNRFGAHRSSYFASAAHAGPGLSGLTLLRRLEPPKRDADMRDPLQIAAGHVIPTLTAGVPLGDNVVLSIFFKLYPDRAVTDPPRLVIDLLRDGKLLSRSTPELPASDANGEIPYLANLPVGTLKPGQYEFRATVLQGNAVDQKTIPVTLE